MTFPLYAGEQYLIDLIHDTRNLRTRFRTDGIKAMSPGISGGKQKINLPIREIAVDFVYSLKTKQRFNGHAKCTVCVSAKFTSLLLAVRTSTVASALKKSNNDHFHP